MANMRTHAKRQTPGQKIHRLELIIETARENQSLTGWILTAVSEGDIGDAKLALREMYGLDRDFTLNPGGILTSTQIELLK